MEASNNISECAINNATPQKEKRKKSYPGKKANHYDGKWFSWYTKKWNRPTGIALVVGPASYFDNRARIRLSLGWITFYINLPIYSTWDECEVPEYGFYVYEGKALVICKGLKTKHIYMPWYLDWVRSSRLLKDGTWVTETKGDKKNFWEDEWKDKLWQETHKYIYVTEDQQIQDDIDATIGVSIMEWRPRWFRWTKMFAKVRKSIEIEFNNEVGNRRGSWKGGCTGCGYEMRDNESPLQTLRRMQRERSFDR